MTLDDVTKSSKNHPKSAKNESHTVKGFLDSHQDAPGRQNLVEYAPRCSQQRIQDLFQHPPRRSRSPAKTFQDGPEKENVGKHHLFYRTWFLFQNIVINIITISLIYWQPFHFQ